MQQYEKREEPGWPFVKFPKKKTLLERMVLSFRAKRHNPYKINTYNGTRWTNRGENYDGASG